MQIFLIKEQCKEKAGVTGDAARVCVCVVWCVCVCVEGGGGSLR
jgi:hypothetical protein